MTTSEQKLTRTNMEEKQLDVSDLLSLLRFIGKLFHTPFPSVFFINFRLPPASLVQFSVPAVLRPTVSKRISHISDLRLSLNVPSVSLSEKFDKRTFRSLKFMSIMKSS